MLTPRNREGAFKSRGSARVGIDFLPHLLGFEGVPGGYGHPWASGRGSCFLTRSAGVMDEEQGLTLSLLKQE